jgi:hypothetical protein
MNDRTAAIHVHSLSRTNCRIAGPGAAAKFQRHTLLFSKPSHPSRSQPHSTTEPFRCNAQNDDFQHLNGPAQNIFTILTGLNNQ